MKRCLLALSAVMAVIVSSVSCTSASQEKERIVVAYVIAWNDVMPDPMVMTHINYAFGKVNETFDGVLVQNPGRLKDIVALKDKNRNLKVLLSIGGWGAGGFSEMASTGERRSSFALDCRRIVDEYGLDGIDLDWEYPTSSESGIVSSPEDTDNFTSLVKAIRAAIGPDALLTMASVCSALFVDFPSVIDDFDFINVMSYDMRGSRHDVLHNALYPSELSGYMCTDGAVKAHLEAGVPKEKLVVGVPFYGRGVVHDYVDFKDMPSMTEYIEHWDEAAQVPYLVDSLGNFELGFENARSMEIKCRYILEQDCLGAMYWEYSTDTEDGILRNLTASIILH